MLCHKSTARLKVSKAPLDFSKWVLLVCLKKLFLIYKIEQYIDFATRQNKMVFLQEIPGGLQEITGDSRWNLHEIREGI